MTAAELTPARLETVEAMARGRYTSSDADQWVPLNLSFAEFSELLHEADVFKLDDSPLLSGLRVLEDPDSVTRVEFRWERDGQGLTCEIHASDLPGALKNKTNGQIAFLEGGIVDDFGNRIAGLLNIYVLNPVFP